MKKTIWNTLCAGLLTLSCMSTANAATVTIDFTASGFRNSGGVLTAPYDPVSGSISYAAATATSFVDSILSIDLNIGGYQYAVNEILFKRFDTTRVVFGAGSVANGFSWGTDDFYFIWDFVSQGPNDRGDTMAYTSSSVPPDYWWVSTVDYTVSTVPIPAAVWLLGSGLIGLVSISRRKKA